MEKWSPRRVTQYISDQARCATHQQNTTETAPEGRTIVRDSSRRRVWRRSVTPTLPLTGGAHDPPGRSARDSRCRPPQKLPSS